MNAVFYYEIKREYALRVEEQQAIRELYAIYRYGEEQTENARGCIPYFQMFEVPLLFSESIDLPEKEPHLIAHWCCLLDALKKTLEKVTIHAYVDQEELIEGMMGFVLPSLDAAAFSAIKAEEEARIQNKTIQEEPKRYLRSDVYLSTYDQPCTPEAVAQLETEWNIKLSASYRQFLLSYAGGKLQDIVYSGEEDESIYLECLYGMEAFSTYRQDAQFQQMIARGYLPIGEDAFGYWLLLCGTGRYEGYIVYARDFTLANAVFLEPDFTAFLLHCHTTSTLYDTVDRDSVQVLYTEPKQNLWKQRRRFLSIEQHENKAYFIEELFCQPEEAVEGYVHFTSFTFKLAIIQELMYRQHRLPLFDLKQYLLAMDVDVQKVQLSGCIYHALEYFKQLRIPVDLAMYVQELVLDIHQEVYQNIALSLTQEDEKNVWLVDLTQEDLAQFPHLKKVRFQMRHAREVVELLRQAGIVVEDTCQKEDPTCARLLQLLQNWEHGGFQVKETTSVQQLYQHLTACYGADYEVLYDDEIKKSCDQPLPLFEGGYIWIQQALQQVGLTLCIFDCTHHVIVPLLTKNQGLLLAKLAELPAYQLTSQGTYGILHIQKCTASFHNAYQKKEESSAPSSLAGAQKKKRNQRLRLMILSIIMIPVLFFTINHILVSRQSYLGEEDLHYGIQIRRYYRYDMLEDSKGNPLVKGRYENIQLTYSSLVILCGNLETNHNQIYDVQKHAFLDGEFLETIPVRLKENDHALDYQGVLATKDRHTYVLYSQKHKQGIKTTLQDDDIVYREDVFDVDSGVRIKKAND